MNILLIRLRLLGDVVFTTPAVRALERRFPDATLSYLVEPAAAPVLRSNRRIDELIVSPRLRGVARVVEDVSLAARLRARRFDVVFDFHGGPRSAWLCAATGAPERVGYTITGRSWLYTRRVPRDRELRARHSVQCQWDLLRGFDPSFGQPDPAVDAVEMPEDPDAASGVASRLSGAGLDDHALIVVHVSAGNPFRRWPVAAFAETIVALARADARRRIIVTAGPSDASARRRVQREAWERLGPRRDAVPDLGEFDLPHLRALIGRAALFIGGDTGPLHVAATTSVPIVGLYGPTLSARSRPWRDPIVPTASVELADLPCRPCDQRVCEPGDYRCLTTLSTTGVVQAAERVLADADRPSSTQSAVS